jgi:hypothetical protein
MLGCGKHDDRRLELFFHEQRRNGGQNGRRGSNQNEGATTVKNKAKEV